MNKANNLRLTVAFATLVTVMIASGQGRPGAVKAPQVPRAAPQVQYTVIDLGTDGVGNQITDSGRIVGSINFGGPDRDAAFWPTPQSPPIDLGTLPGFTGSRGFGVNPRGEIVGYALAAYPVLSARPLFWASTQSAPMELPGLPVGLAGLADAISPVGQIVGVFFASDFSVSQPVVWPRSNAAPIYLPELSETLRFGAPSASMLWATSSATASTKTLSNLVRCSGPTAQAPQWRWLRPEGNSFTQMSP